MTPSRLILATLLVVMLLVSTRVGLGNVSNNAPSSQNLTSESLNVGTTYGVGLSGSPVTLNLNTLMQLTGNKQDAISISRVMQEYFLPLGVNTVILDIGWSRHAQTATTKVAGGFQQWVSNFLAAAQVNGIAVLFEVRYFGAFFPAPSWEADFLTAYPEAATVNGTGISNPLGTTNCGPFPSACASAFSIASPYVITQYETDLNQLCSWYCNYKSWVGLATGLGFWQVDYMLPFGTVSAARPFDNTTISTYATTQMFNRLITPNGYYIGTSVQSNIWKMFVAKTNSFNTSVLYEEIVQYDSQDPKQYPLEGWNAFLLYYQAFDLYTVIQYAQQKFDKHFFYWTDLPPSVFGSIPNVDTSRFVYSVTSVGPLNCSPTDTSCGGSNTFWADDMMNQIDAILGGTYQDTTIAWNSIGNTRDNQGTLTQADLRTQFLLKAVTARNPLGLNDWSPSESFDGITNVQQQEIVNQFGAILNRMVYNGGYYGTERDAVRVLWLDGGNLVPDFLTPAANVTVIDPQYGNQNLTQYGDLSQFSVIVGNMSRPTPSLVTRMQNFIRNGGGYVNTQYAGGLNTVLGLQSTTSPSRTSSFIVLSPNPITSPYSTVKFNLGKNPSPMQPINSSSLQVFVADSNGNPVITSNAYGLGRAVWLPQDTLYLFQEGNSYQFESDLRHTYGSPRSSWISLLINSIFYAAKQDSMLPIIWESNFSTQQNWSPLLQFSIDGRPGAPVLLWLSNNDSSSSQFDIHLSAKFFGISNQSWIAIDVQDMSVLSNGSGNDIHVSVSVPSFSWMPIYITNSTQNLHPIYSTAAVLSESFGNASSGIISVGSNTTSH